MTDKEFRTLCKETEIGETLTLTLDSQQTRGKFIGCTQDGVIIESNGQVSIWPLDLVEYRKTANPTPSYS